MKHIFINGQAKQTICLNISQLIEELNIEGKRFAIERNQIIIPKSKFTETLIADQDRIEIIHAVGGG
ncbi:MULTISPECIES: sulfur carrier protein ThiS [Acinetobacter]|uniref:sulfur carrier protein ThiS n=1 Tax=Acinetobacter TaxID=469 RepID=UPI002DBD75ED|nr:sulfur carrier protein ThiS [Acinetobacter haemolyticus]MDA0696752.1 sulfur carrier protein ThiS [Pseudomonadota bacterium]MDA1254808.1 sulfur carrier protein ThiS [Pseudomonadota bacterium]MEB6678104.1 sulfur carrier protein ThiS [Acinetobacter haemolyticus]